MAAYYRAAFSFNFTINTFLQKLAFLNYMACYLLPNNSFYERFLVAQKTQT